MPGSDFLKTADEMYKTLHDSTWNIYDWCKDNIVCIMFLQSQYVVNFVYIYLLLNMNTWNMSSALTFWMAMILHPEVQAKAQAEIDAAIGQDQLPLISDKPKLPYVRSILTEVFRWGPTGSLGQLWNYP